MFCVCLCLFAFSLERVVPELLTTLAKDGSDCKTSVADQQALAKQLADIFDFALRFDALRMLRPFLPNDFSYYRRLLPKFSKHERVKVKDDEASGMALFTPQHIPMMTALATATAATMERVRMIINRLMLGRYINTDRIGFLWPIDTRHLGVVFKQ